MSKFFKGALIVLAVLVLIAGGFGFYITRGLAEGAKVTLNSVDLAGIQDGDYKGSYKLGRWSNEVEVTVKDHKISDIRILKDVRFPLKDVTDKMIQEVIEKQDVNVDVVSGATVTSKAYLKSIENALSGGTKKE
ncbi:MAG: FMN-binding protein [Clostridiales bacterium]|jgi:uncharacterized protein with FMN-binding domain|nr:FMN-binding protein [Eubacteriales bacterium]MDH7567489.1 FMN-binding protein [Clostridiales bacterium]